MKFSDIRKIVDPLIKEMMIDLGFKKVKYTYNKNIGKDYVMMILFSETGQGKGYYDLVPFLLLDSNKLNTILHKYNTNLGTFGHRKALGYVTDKKTYTWWTFTPDNTADYQNMVNNIRKNIEKYGIPYLEKLSSDPMLFADATKSCGIPMQYYANPITYYLAGDIEKSKKILDSGITDYYENSEIKKAPISIYSDYLEFRKLFLKYMEDNK